MMSIITGYVGTYTSPAAPGTYRFTWDSATGRVESPMCLYPGANTKYAAYHAGRLATLTQRDGRAGLCLMDVTRPEAEVLDTRLDETVTACSLMWHDHRLYTTNYHGGQVHVYRVEEDHLIPMETLSVAPEAGCHQVLFHQQLLLVPCLCLDRVLLFDRTKDFAQVGAILCPAGSGPRHGVFTADHKRFYLVSERSNQLFSYAVSGADFVLESITSILPDHVSGKAETAAIRMSADERTLYISVRGADLLVVFRVGGEENSPALLQRLSSEGHDPWDIALMPNGAFLLVSDRGSDALVSFALGADGTLGAEVSRLSIPQCVGISLQDDA